ncbi:MAG: DciA family protein [Brevinematia bacterium]
MISSIVKKLLSRYIPPSMSIMYSILSNWKNIAGDFLFKHAVPYKFFVKKSELYIACDDPIIANEIYFSQNELKRRIKEETKLTVKTIKTVYDINKFTKFSSLLGNEKKEKETTPSITTEKKRKIEKLTSKVKDTELKEALKTFFETLSIVEKYRKL